MTIGICPPPSGPTPVAREMRSLRWYRDRILKDEKLLPSLFEELQGKTLGAWDVDSPNSHSQVLLKLHANISLIMTPSTFFARFVSCKSLLSNFYKHDFWFRGKSWLCTQSLSIPLGNPSQKTQGGQVHYECLLSIPHCKTKTFHDPAQESTWHRHCNKVDVQTLTGKTQTSQWVFMRMQSSPSNVSSAKIQGILFGVPVAPPPRSPRKIFACIVAPTYWAGSLCWSTWEEKKCSWWHKHCHHIPPSEKVSNFFFKPSNIKKKFFFKNLNFL